MKQIVAIIRPEHVQQTKDALLKVGIAAYTAREVQGKGKESVTVKYTDEITIKTGLLHKRMMLIVVKDDEVQKVIDAVMSINSSQNKGDGKIFVTPVLRSYRISSGELIS